ncbi:MAG: putative baseplate assembly protein, partial [Pseudomonadota bacterium]
MPLQAPELDTRRFRDLLEEARARIPHYTPDWTNFNDADPGMTLVQLQVWLTETLLYQLNRLPELNYVKFLNLLQVTPKPASSAVAELTFKLKKLSRASDPLTVLIPRRSQVAVDDADLEREVIFETDYTLNALNATVGALITTVPESPQRRLVTRYDEDDKEAVVLHSFLPVGEAPSVDDEFLIGLLLRPTRNDGEDYSQDAFPEGELDLTVMAAEILDQTPDGEVIEGPVAEQALLPFEASEAAAGLAWEMYVGTDHASQFTNDDAWRTLTLRGDESAGLTDSGHVRLEIPAGASQVSFQQLPRSPFWTRLGLNKPPVTLGDLTDDLLDGGLDLVGDMLDEEAWLAIGVPEDRLADVLSCCADPAELVSALSDIVADGATLDPSELPFSFWTEDIDAGYDNPAVPAFPMVWLRARVVDTPQPPGLLTGVLLNTVPAIEAATRLQEALGTS